MKEIKSAAEVVKEAFELNIVRGLFKELYTKSPLGKEKFQNLAKSYGEDALKSESMFLKFAQEAGFSGTVISYDTLGWLDTEYEFNNPIQ